MLETSLSGITELPFGAFVALMQPIHLAIGLIEGLVTAAVLVFVYESRPELLRDVDTNAQGVSAKRSLKTVVVILAVVAALVGGGLSLLASSNPDGLEWALFGNAEAGYSENMGLDEENFGVRAAWPTPRAACRRPRPSCRTTPSPAARAPRAPRCPAWWARPWWRAWRC